MIKNHYDPSQFENLPEEAQIEFELAYITDLMETENYDAALDWACQHHDYLEYPEIMDRVVDV